VSSYRRPVGIALVSAALIAGCDDGVDRQHTAEKLAVASASHPYAGFWKRPGCANNFGLAIAPAGSATYAIAFCGPGGCSKPGMMRNTRLVGDPDYRIVDQDTIEVSGTDGFMKHVRCDKR
jgi:hypothetical protein